MSYEPKKAQTIESTNFIEKFINEDIEEGKVKNYIHTRFPPEPNGYLHIGHLKAIYIDFSIAEKYQGLCNLRYDDTNPEKEEVEFAISQQEDIKWLGFDWTGGIFYGSDYFAKTYEFAVELIKKGKAYVDELSPEETREYRGTLTSPGKNSPYRDRPVEENLKLFDEMKEGKYEDGTLTLRAKIDMSSPNINMRDPVIYRIKHAEHWRAGDKWCIYPMYDFAHPIQDALENITHSLCSLEYEAHRPLYDWVVDELGFEHKPRQIEFARLNITGTVMSKRLLRRLVEEGYVDGWDDPRMPTIRGLRRRGFTSAAIKDFVKRAGIAKADSIVDYKLLEHCVREDLNENAPRAMVVTEPLKVVITSYEGSEVLTGSNHPNHPEFGEREMTFSREIYIEKGDFWEDAPSKYHRLKKDGEVRLINAYIIKFEKAIKDENGNVIELHCTHDATSKSGGETSGRKVKGTIHWVDANNYVPVEIKNYDDLIDESIESEDFIDRLNKNSLTIINDAVAEKSLESAKQGDKFQFMRQGYYCLDSKENGLVFNRTVSLKDAFSRTIVS
ncbi:MAG: glutamine--tRNA ligase/YqeY domain fusion protein [Clostridia bacterium]|nr:glutamine--tRNA ligase/YqeY domain fusion protein [Clostridia bacterium]